MPPEEIDGHQPLQAANAEKVRMLRGFLAVAEQRTNDPAALAAALATAREDGELIAQRIASMLAGAFTADGISAEAEDEALQELTGFIGARTDALRANGLTDNEAMAYAIGATIAAAEAIEWLRSALH